jgi:DNA adenine methylase
MDRAKPAEHAATAEVASIVGSTERQPYQNNKIDRGASKEKGSTSAHDWTGQPVVGIESEAAAPGAARALIGAIAPWYGSKRTLAPVIVHELGKHRAYWEPFCGSMAVLLAKPACSMETANDLHGDLINLARIVKDPQLGPQLYRRLRRILPAQEELFDARRRMAMATEAVGIDRAEAYFVNSWLSMNGAAGTAAAGESSRGARRGICRRFSSGGGAPGIRFAGAVASIPAWRRRLRTVFVLQQDGTELCERIEDRAGTVIYADPPYLKKGERYIHDFDRLAHRRLAKVLGRFQKTRVVVSYYDHPDLATLYPGWTKREVHITKALGNQGRRDVTGKLTKAPEVLLINGPSLAKGGRP